MTINEIKFDPTPKVQRSKRNTLFQMRRKLVFMHYPSDADVDELGAKPYTDMEDYLTGADGTGVWADIDTPHPDDVLMAAQHGEVLTHSILVRYDERIDPRQIIKYTNRQTGKSDYWWIRTLVRPDFEYHYLRIGAEQIIEYGVDE
jgi:hypothetical protein